MSGVFIKILNLSLSASWLILAVILLRALLKKAPKWFPCALWAIVAIRLILPFSFESATSLIPSSEPIPAGFVSMENPKVESGITYINEMINPAIAKAVSPSDNTADASSAAAVNAGSNVDDSADKSSVPTMTLSKPDIGENIYSSDTKIAVTIKQDEKSAEATAEAGRNAGGLFHGGFKEEWYLNEIDLHGSRIDLEFGCSDHSGICVVQRTSFEEQNCCFDRSRRWCVHV